MTQPPYGSGPDYPKQQLSPQQVAPRRPRWPLIVGAVAVVVVLAGVLITLRVVHDNGERSRAAYCTALRTLTHNGHIVEAFSGLSEGSTAQIDHLRDIAPSAVKGQWDDVVPLLSRAPTSMPDMALAARVVTDLTAIVNDAKSSCGLSLQLMP